MSTSAPKSNEAFFSLIDSLEQQRALPEAIEQLTAFVDEGSKTDDPNHKDLGIAFFIKGDLLISTGKNNEAVKAYENGLEHSILAQDSTHICGAYLGMGNGNVYMGNYEIALDYYNKALEIAYAINDKYNIAIILNSLGKVYEYWHQFDKALEFFFQSLEICEELNEEGMMSVRMASIASVYKNQGKTNPSKFAEAIKWYELALEIETKNNSIIRRAYRLDQLGEVYVLTGDFEKANKYLSEALEIFRNNNIKNSEAIVLNHIALHHLKQGQFINAKKHYNQSLLLSEQIGFNNMILKNLQEMTSMYENMGDYKNAHETNMRYTEIKDSTFNARTQQQIADFQTKYETQEKEKELAILNQEKIEQELKLNQANQQRIVLAGILLMLIILLITIYSQYRLKKRTQEHLAYINDQLSELNMSKDKLFSIVSHDMKNSMAGFCSLIETLNKQLVNITPEQLKHFLGELSLSSSALREMMKNLLEWAKTQQNTVRFENNIINIHDLFNEVIAQNKQSAGQRNIDMNLNITDPEMQITTDQNVVATILRNLISNALKFSPNNSTIEIDVSKEGKELHFSVSDVGAGMEQEQIDLLLNSNLLPRSKPGINGEKGSGIGLRLSIDLLRKISGDVTVTSTKNKGTKFDITIPDLST
jgi:signal transduction histidine kinase